jgi:hypothetical protein
MERGGRLVTQLSLSLDPVEGNVLAQAKPFHKRLKG